MSYKCAEEWREDPLPEKLSALVRLAVADLVACERDPAYRISMETYHAPLDDLCCWVCLAGTVIAKRLDAAPWHDVKPHDFIRSIDWKLLALDVIRQGNINWALNVFHGDHDLRFPFERVDVPAYEDDPAGFKKALRRIADLLEKEGE